MTKPKPKKPRDVKWVVKDGVGNWRFPDGTIFNYGTKHPKTGKGGKGIKKSYEHRMAMSRAQKIAKNTPEQKAKMSAAAKKYWARAGVREESAVYIARSIKSRRKNNARRAKEKEQFCKVLEIRNPRQTGYNQKALTKTIALQLLQKYDLEPVPDQDDYYYASIVKALDPQKAAILKLR